MIIEYLILVTGNKEALKNALTKLSETHTSPDEKNTQYFHMHFMVPLSQHIHKYQARKQYEITVKENVFRKSSFKNHMELLENARFGPLYLWPSKEVSYNVEFLYNGILEAIKEYELMEFI